MGCNSCVGLGTCKSDPSLRKSFGWSGVERSAADNASYMLQSFPCHTEYSPRVAEAVLNGPCKPLPLSIIYAVKCLCVEVSS